MEFGSSAPVVSLFSNFLGGQNDNYFLRYFKIYKKSDFCIAD